MPQLSSLVRQKGKIKNESAPTPLPEVAINLSGATSASRGGIWIKDVTKKVEVPMEETNSPQHADASVTVQCKAQVCYIILAQKCARQINVADFEMGGPRRAREDPKFPKK